MNIYIESIYRYLYFSYKMITSFAVLCVPTIRIKTTGRAGSKCIVCHERQASLVLSATKIQLQELPDTSI